MLSETFCFVVNFMSEFIFPTGTLFFKTGFLCVALATLELSL